MMMSHSRCSYLVVPALLTFRRANKGVDIPLVHLIPFARVAQPIRYFLFASEKSWSSEKEVAERQEDGTKAYDQAGIVVSQSLRAALRGKNPVLHAEGSSSFDRVRVKARLESVGSSSPL